MRFGCISACLFFGLIPAVFALPVNNEITRRAPDPLEIHITYPKALEHLESKIYLVMHSVLDEYRVNLLIGENWKIVPMKTLPPPSVQKQKGWITAQIRGPEPCRPPKLSQGKDSKDHCEMLVYLKKPTENVMIKDATGRTIVTKSETTVKPSSSRIN
ncbi:hypothetical protein BDP27DRAFT_1401549 [Rhodocollybia butyracea]|uniref:Secreted protein n=1 Tax=Rhodocollybia butyracea TaxID=206335 RepID=A0A9P5U8P1_9AGAR|nr:hypothetical protein BDP27DRAFT_1401549 [Rhodocollybia butyracea]